MSLAAPTSTMRMRAHGTHARYVLGPDIDDTLGRGCRCEDCRTANRLYERDRAARIEPAYVDAGPAREHVAALMAAGVGLKTIAAAAAVPHGTLSKLVYGDRVRGMAPSKRVRPETLAKLLTVSVSDAADGARVPAAPTLANVRRLVQAGVPKVRIAERLGQTGPGLQLGRRFVTRRHARTIAEMVEELDAGTLVTVRRHRHGDTVVAPEGRRLRTVPNRLDEVDVWNLTPAPPEQGASWRHEAACRERPPWIWFPADNDRKTIAAAKRICGACFVRADCLQAGRREAHGIYGGLTPHERNRQGILDVPLQRSRA